VYSLITAVAAQVDTDVPVRERNAWTTDLDVELAPSLSTSSMPQPDGLRSVA
jgi:hypothetical protein